MRLIVLSFIIFVLMGCGYKPTSYYAKKELSGTIYVEAKININNTENSIIIKDTINKLLIDKFNGKLSKNKKTSNYIVLVELSNVTYKSIYTDNEGYTKTYRAIVDIVVKYKKQAKKSYFTTIKVSNYEDYYSDDDSQVSQRNKLDAVKEAISKAMMDLFSKIAIESLRD